MERRDFFAVPAGVLLAGVAFSGAPATRAAGAPVVHSVPSLQEIPAAVATEAIAGDWLASSGFAQPGRGGAVYRLVTAQAMVPGINLVAARAFERFPRAVRRMGDLYAVLASEAPSLSMFGAGEGGDDTEAVREAFAFCARAGLRLLDHGGTYEVGGTLYDDNAPLFFEGAGLGRTLFRLSAQFSGPVIRLREQTMGTLALEPARGGYVRAEDAYLANTRLAGFTISASPGHKPAVDGVVVAGTVDQLSMERIDFLYLNGSAFAVRPAVGKTENDFSCLRESYIREIKATACGSSQRAAIELSTYGDGDGSNQCVFEHIRVVYPRGVALAVTNFNGKRPVRRISFRDVMLHGMPEERASADMLLVAGRVGSCTWENIKINNVHADAWAVTIRGNESGAPANLRFQLDINHCASGVRVEAGTRVSVQPLGMQCDQVAIDVAPASRTSFVLEDPDWVMGEIRGL